MAYISQLYCFNVLNVCAGTFREYYSRQTSPDSAMILESLNHSPCQEQRNPDETPFQTRLPSAKVLHIISHCQQIFFSKCCRKEYLHFYFYRMLSLSPRGFGLTTSEEFLCFKNVRKKVVTFYFGLSTACLPDGEQVLVGFCPFIPSSLESQTAPHAKCSLLICTQCRKTVLHWFSQKKSLSS